MNFVRFEWDAGKDSINQKKHGLSFSNVLSVFMDPNVLNMYDDAHSGLEEDRWISIGRTDKGIVCLVCHTYVSKDDVQSIRIISARKADKDEERQYYSL